MGTAYDNYSTKRRIIQSRSGNDMKVDNIGLVGKKDSVEQRCEFDKNYFVNQWFTGVAPESTVTITIYTGTKYPHGRMYIGTDSEITADLTLSTCTDGLINGTQFYQHNMNRGMNNSRSVCSFYYNDTGTGKAGDLYKTLEIGHFGASSTEVPRQYTKLSSEGEATSWLLDTGRVYNIHFKNESAVTCYIVWKYAYHEHDAIESSTTTNYGESATEYSGEIA